MHRQLDDSTQIVAAECIQRRSRFLEENLVTEDCETFNLLRISRPHRDAIGYGGDALKHIVIIYDGKFLEEFVESGKAT